MRFIPFAAVVLVLGFAGTSGFAKETSHAHRIPAGLSYLTDVSQPAPASVGQAEQMLNDSTQVKSVDTKTQKGPHFLASCEAPYGAYYVSNQDLHKYERCMDDPHRQAAGAALISLPN